KALDLQRRLADGPDADADDRVEVARTLHLRGLLLLANDKPAQAETAFREEARRADAATAEQPGSLKPRARAVLARFRLADVLEQTGRRDEADALCRRALAEQRALVAASHGDAEHRRNAASMATALAAFREPTDPDAAHRLLEEVVRDEVAAAGSRAAAGSPPLRKAFMNLGAFLNRQRRHAGLLQLANDLAKTTPDDCNEVYNAACFAANAAAAAQDDRGLSDADRGKLADACGRRAVELLQRAVQGGYTKRDHMAEDMDLDPLRGRPDFQAFWADLDRRKPGKPLTADRVLAGYCKQYESAVAGYDSRRGRALTEAERRLVERSKPNPADFAPRFLKFAADHAADPAAVEALAWVLENVEPGGAGLELRNQALGVLEREHMNKPNLAAVCERLAESPSAECERLLRAVSERHASPEARGAAAVVLADALAQRAQEQYATDRAASAALFAEAERLYEWIQRDHAAVAYSQSTLGEIAPAKLHDLRHLAVGRPAMPIAGKDLDGRS
ncbi:MAG TPA: hypothetical protein VGF55_02870, partial [Gemmataceae bacterium]